MNEPLFHGLAAIRKTCLEIKAEASSSAQSQLDSICFILAKQIVDTRDLPGLKQALVAQFADRLSLVPGVRAGQDFDAIQALIQQAIEKDVASSPALLKLAVDLGGAFALAYDRAIMAEVAETAKLGSASKPQDEAFDTGSLGTYLREIFPDETDVEIAGANIVSLGFSKKTVIVGLKGNKVLPDEIVLRIDRPYNFLGTNVEEEYVPLVALHAHGVRVAKPYALEPTGKIVDGPFIMVERIKGAAVGNNLVFPPRNLELAQDVAVCLAQVHRMPVEAIADLRGMDHSILEGVRWEIDKSYADWRGLNRDVPVMEAAFNWLKANIHLADGPRAVLHGDYNFNNLLVEGNRVSAIVDWEFVHAGTPASDLGWFHYGAEGVIGWEKFLDLYVEAGGTRPSKSALDYYILLAQARFCTMSLQTDSGFDTGKFDDIRFGRSGVLVLNKVLARVSKKLQELLSGT